MRNKDEEHKLTFYIILVNDIFVFMVVGHFIEKDCLKLLAIEKFEQYSITKGNLKERDNIKNKVKIL